MNEDYQMELRRQATRGMLKNIATGIASRIAPDAVALAILSGAVAAALETVGPNSVRRWLQHALNEVGQNDA